MDNKVWVKDRNNGNKLSISQDELPDAINSGSFVMQSGKDIEVIAPDGERGVIPSDQIESAVREGGFQVLTPSMKKEQEGRAWAADNPTLAAGLGAARGVSFGLSDALVPEEYKKDVQYLKEENPIASTLGDVAGNIAPLIASGGTSLLARGASKLGAGVIAGETLGVAAGKKVASTVAKALGASPKGSIGEAAKTILAKSAGFAGGSAIEGALYGAGSTIGEHSLENKELTAEALVQNSLMSGGIGALFGGTLGGVGAGASMLIDSGGKIFMRRMVKASDLDDATKELALKKVDFGEKLDEFNAGFNVNKDMKTVQDLDDLGIKMAEGDLPLTITSPDESMLGLGGKREAKKLAASETSIGERELAKNNEVRRALEDKVENDILSGRSDSAFEAGEEMQELMMSKLDDSANSFKDIYKARDEMGSVPIDLPAKQEFMRGIDFGLKSRSKEFVGAANNIKRALTGANSMKAIKELRTSVHQEAQALDRAGRFGDAAAVREIYGGLKDLERKSVRAGFNDKEKADKFLGLWDAADKEFISHIEKWEPVFKKAGFRGRMPKYAEDLPEFFEKVKTEGIIKKMSDLKDFKNIEMLAKDFPEMHSVVKSKILKDIHDFASSGLDEAKRFSIPKFVNKVADYKKKYPEVMNTIFSKKQLEDISKIDRLEKIIAKDPGVVFTGRSNADAINFSASNLFGALPWARDKVKEAVLKGDVLGVKDHLGKKYATLAELESKKIDLTKKINKHVKNFLRTTNRAVRMSVLSNIKMTKDDIEETESFINTYLNNPDMFIEQFQNENKNMIEDAPETSALTQERIDAGMQFLQSKMPKRHTDFYGQPFDPSRGEVMAFSEYLTTVKNPDKFLESIEAGYVSKRQVEAMQAVYPETLETIRRSAMAQMTELKANPQKMRAIEDLLGIKTKPSKNPLSIALLQNNSSQMAANAINSPVGGSKSLKKGNLKRDNRELSSLDATLNRRQLEA